VVILPSFSNWLLFSAAIEAFFHSIGEDWDRCRIDYGHPPSMRMVQGRWFLRRWSATALGLLQQLRHQPMLLAVLDATSKTTKAGPISRPSSSHARAAMLSFKSASSHLTAPFPPSAAHYLSL